MTEPAPQPRQTPWRKPTGPEHVCVGCQGVGIFGTGDTWQCRDCVDPSFFSLRDADDAARWER